MFFIIFFNVQLTFAFRTFEKKTKLLYFPVDGGIHLYLFSKRQKAQKEEEGILFLFSIVFSITKYFSFKNCAPSGSTYTKIGKKYFQNRLLSYASEPETSSSEIPAAASSSCEQLSLGATCVGIYTNGKKDGAFKPGCIEKVRIAESRK